MLALPCYFSNLFITYDGTYLRLNALMLGAGGVDDYDDDDYYYYYDGGRRGNGSSSVDGGGGGVGVSITAYGSIYMKRLK